MKRLLILGGLIATGTLSMTVSAYQLQPRAPEPAVKVVEAIKVKDNLFLLTGGGGSTGVLIGTNGVVVIDTKNPGWGQPLLNKIKELTPKPVTMIINTHSHLDHVAGNIDFPATVDVVAQENTAANMKRVTPVTGLVLREASEYGIFSDTNGKNLPKRTFKDRMTLGNGNDRIDLYYFGRAHTDGDAVVVFPALRVAHFGDMFRGKGPVLLDANAGGSGVEYPATLMKAYSTIKNVDTIINGHATTTTTWPDLKEYADYVTAFVDYARAKMKAGASVNDAAAGFRTPAQFKGYETGPADRVKSNMQVIYNELGTH
jgi:glyoxylase-like metal-dependent hydrolase (beta-lactamase superfamily II)